MKLIKRGLSFSSDLTAVTYYQCEDNTITINQVMDECKIYYYEFTSDMPHDSLIGACCCKCLLLNKSSLGLIYMHHHACISMDTVFAGTRAYYEEYRTFGTRPIGTKIGILFDLRDPCASVNGFQNVPKMPMVCTTISVSTRGKMYAFIDGQSHGMVVHNISLNLRVAITLKSTKNNSPFTLRINPNATAPREEEWENVNQEYLRRKKLHIEDRVLPLICSIACHEGLEEAIFA
jgi:hypothetical protein